jgi:hypothetical protein
LRGFLRRKATELRYAGTASQRRSADIFIVSFPKSGRTWHRMLLGSYLNALSGRNDRSPTDVQGITADELGARVSYSHNGATFEDGLPADHPAVARSAFWRGKKVIFLVREPKDVMVSAWFHAHYRTRRYSGSLAEFIRSPVTGIAKLVSARNRWWTDRGEAEEYMFLSYEQMQLDARAALEVTLAFAGRWPIEAEKIEEAVSRSSFSRMQQAEAAARKSRRDENVEAASSTAGFKAREGKTGGYVQYMTPQDIAYVDEAAKSIIDPLAFLYRTPAPAVSPDFARVA